MGHGEGKGKKARIQDDPPGHRQNRLSLFSHMVSVVERAYLLNGP